MVYNAAENGADTDRSSNVRGSNQSGLRAHNERVVLSLLRRHGPLPKAEIARVSGLSAQTVSVIMRRLEAEGLLIKGDPVRGRVGQPSVPMALAPDGAFFLGLKVGRRSVELVLTDFLGIVLDRRLQTHAFPTPEATLDFARSGISDMLDRLDPDQRDRIAGLGIAMPFFLWNWAEQLGVPNGDMNAWRDADIRANLDADYPFTVFLQNDGTAACGAELVFGPADAPRDFLYFYIGYFIGGGVVLNGRVYSGVGNAAALGPLPVPGPQGVRQLISVASLSGLETRLKANGANTDCLWESPEGWDVDDIILRDWLAEAADGLAHAVVSACALIDFPAVRIDGWIPRALCTDLVEAVNHALDRRDMTGLVRPSVEAGTVGADARSLGAASLPLSERYLVDT